MEPTDALAQIAVVSRDVLDLREAKYPATGLAPKYPGLVLLMGETTIDYASGEQYWTMQVRGLLMTGLVNDTKHHVNEVDPLLARLVDEFAPGTDAAILQLANGDRADNCLIRSIDGSQAIGYAGQQHYGAVINWDVQFRRFNP